MKKSLFLQFVDIYVKFFRKQINVEKISIGNQVIPGLYPDRFLTGVYQQTRIHLDENQKAETLAYLKKNFCPLCHTRLMMASGLGQFCPNTYCEVLDGADLYQWKA